MAGRSSRLPSAFVRPGPPSIQLPGQIVEHPLERLPRAGSPGWGRQDSVRAVLGPPKGRNSRGRQLEASGATAVSRRGPPGERPGPSVAFPRRGAEGWRPPGALPARAEPPHGFCSEPPAPLPAPRAVLALGAGPAGAAERDEGRFLKLYFSAGSFRVNELTS